MRTQLRDRRHRLGATQTQIGELAGMSQGRISEYENGKEFGLDALLRVADALNQTVALTSVVMSRDRFRDFCRRAVTSGYGGVPPGIDQAIEAIADRYALMVRGLEDAG